MIDEIKKNFELLGNPEFDFSLEEMRKKHGDSILKSKEEINRIT